MLRRTLCVCFSLLLVGVSVRAADTIDDLRGQVDELRRAVQKREEVASPVSRVDTVTAMKYGPDAPVRTKTGKLEISGLIQVWYESIQNDSRGIVNNELNSNNDNDTFRIRRTELRFGMDVHENIFAYVMMDPTREHNIGFTPVPTFPVHNQIIAPAPTRTILTGGGLQAGNTILPQLLQDAYLNFHDVVPHHDFTIGQFKPPTGEEANRGTGYLDFVERAMVTGINNVRDIGVMVHGSWFNRRVEYWAGVFNGPDSTVLADPEIVEGGNRSADHDSKDIAERIRLWPVWDAAEWYGHLELGYARTDGYRGRNGNRFNVSADNFANRANEVKTAINRQSAWLWYRPNGPVKGFWLRGEYGSGHDRFSLNRNPTTILGLGNSDAIFTTLPDGTDVHFQANPQPVTVSGWYGAVGYKVSDSIFSEDLVRCGNSWTRFLNSLEFDVRYEKYQNIATENPNFPDTKTDLFATQAVTVGINYYLPGFEKYQNAKIQANYIVVDDPQNFTHGIREVRNNVFVVSFQVMF